MKETMKEKIDGAIRYAIKYGMDTEGKNNAANVWADSYEEYLIIWMYLKDLHTVKAKRIKI